MDVEKTPKPEELTSAFKKDKLGLPFINAISIVFLGFSFFATFIGFDYAVSIYGFFISVLLTLLLSSLMQNTFEWYRNQPLEFQIYLSSILLVIYIIFFTFFYHKKSN